jgi:hypothetical protein
VTFSFSHFIRNSVQLNGGAWKPVVLAALLLPLGVWRLSARQQNTLEQISLAKCRTILKPWQFSPSAKAGHPAPVASMEWLHAYVTGVVPNLEDRESIRQQINQLPGLKCGEPGVAALRVMPHLEAARVDGKFVLSGELPDSSDLEAIGKLLTRAEPDMNLDDSRVIIDRAVLPVDLPRRVQDAASHPLLATAWQVVNVAWPSVKFDFSGRIPRLSARFPDEKVRDRVLEALKQARPDLVADESDVAIEPRLAPLDVKDPASPNWLPPAWMKEAWELWTVYPSLKLTFQANAVKLNGVISNGPLLNNVMTVMRRLRPDLDFSKGQLLIRNGSLEKPLLLPATVSDWVPPPWLQPAIDQLAAIPVAK